MKKLLSVLLCVLVVAGCGAASQPAASEAGEEPEAALHIDGKIEDSDLSQKLTESLRDHFGGYGNPLYAADWYRYVESLKVFRKDDRYYGELIVNEKPFDWECRLLALRNYTPAVADLVIPLVVDAAAALDLDEMEAAVVSDTISLILNKESGIRTYYAALYSYGIPVYQYIADYLGPGTTELQVMKNIDACYGPDFVAALLAGMDLDFKGSFHGFSTEEVKTIAEYAMIHFDDAFLDSITAYMPDNKLIGTYDNIIPEKESQYSVGPPRLIGFLREQGSKYLTPKTAFRSGEPIWMEFRCYGWEGGEVILFEWKFPDGSSETNSRYYEVDGKDESNSARYLGEACGKGSVTVTIESTGQVLAVFPFEIVK